MTLTVTNSLSGEREAFEPRDPESVLLYFCGLTVSDLPHLGHARAWVHVDVMRRWLEHRGYTVHHVENFTDVNEKIVARIGEDDYGTEEASVARYFITEILDDMRGLNLKRPKVYPRVSEHIPEIIDLVQTLLDRGYAYESNGSVYFDVTQFEDYGTLSNQSIEEIEAQGDEAERSDKRHPADFALWKADAVSPDSIAEHRNPELPPVEESAGETWDSPWGEGRPGWHIECSAMSMTHLDQHIDIHVGGQDLIFPHHENEIAQSEAATGDRFADYWLHVRLLETEGEKMSSSLQNFFTVHNALDEFGPNPVRMFLLSTQYSQRQAYTGEALHEAVERWDRLSRAYERLIEAVDSPDARTKVTDEALRSAVDDTEPAFTAAMDDDFNTREALSALFDLVSATNRHLDDHDEFDYQALTRAIEHLETLAGTALGFRFTDDATAEAGLADDLIELVLAVREEERAAGNFERADAIRADLESLGIEVQDSDSGPSYRVDRR